MWRLEGKLVRARKPRSALVVVYDARHVTPIYAEDNHLKLITATRNSYEDKMMDIVLLLFLRITNTKHEHIFVLNVVQS